MPRFEPELYEKYIIKNNLQDRVYTDMFLAINEKAYLKKDLIFNERIVIECPNCKEELLNESFKAGKVYSDKYTKCPNCNNSELLVRLELKKDETGLYSPYHECLLVNGEYGEIIYTSTTSIIKPK